MDDEEITPHKGGGGDGGGVRRGSNTTTTLGRYPVPAQLSFCPGGITYATLESVMLVQSPSLTEQPSRLVAAAKQADDCLRQYSLMHAAAVPNAGDVTAKTPHFLPSLSVLAEAVFGRLTGCSAEHVRGWADAMVVSQYTNNSMTTKSAPEFVPGTEDDIIHTKPTAVTLKAAPENSVPALLKRLLQDSEQQLQASQARRPRRPCGYVFKRGDIAWNCRTCQTDPTCVICDECFRDSKHDGHEVYFHRTTPGGCCDCGDAEAWNVEGCCDKHRPMAPPQPDHQAAARDSGVDNEVKVPAFALDDPMEAVRMAATARQWAVETLTSDPATKLAPRLLAALGVVIGAAVHCLMDAVDGSGVGADAVQWTKRWADEAARISNSAPQNEDYVFSDDDRQDQSTGPATLQTFLTSNKTLPDNYRLHLRLHNDDVHTYDEVIDALHEPRHIRRNVNNANEQQQLPSLVSLRENATEMTHRVDTDGQVTVKTYNNVAAAMRGFRRLKSRGLHCAMVSTAQVDAENRARALCAWLTDVAASHPAAQALLVHALVQLPGRSNHDDDDLAGVYTWHPSRMIPPWTALWAEQEHSEYGQLMPYNEVSACRQRFDAFPPHLASSYLTREEAELLHGMALVVPSVTGGVNHFVVLTRTTRDFYSRVPYRLPSQRYNKSPHALWGTLPSQYSDPLPAQSKHPLLNRLVSGQTNLETINRLTESVYVVDTDLRKQQEGERITISVFPHKLPGLNMISGIGMTRMTELDARRPPLPSPMDLRHLLATSSFRAPFSPILLLLLLDPYPTKQVRGTIHALFLSLLTNARFKSRFAGALAIAYRPLSTLFCAGVGTEADTPLHFAVQIFTAGSLVRALGHGAATEKLLLSDQECSTEQEGSNNQSSIGVFVPPIAHIIVRCIHTNLLGATKEVNMILNNTASGNDENSQDESILHGNIALLPALTYVAGEHPLVTPLPAAPDDGFLDSRSTRHKRLPHLLRDLDYVIETPGTAIRLLLSTRFPVYQGPSLSSRGDDVLTFPAVFSRMLRLAQGMDPQKRKISGGHVEYEQNRWLEAFGLSLNFGGTRDALAESPCSSINGSCGSDPDDGSHVVAVREAMGNIIASLLREVKLWLYREGMLETGLPIPPGGANGGMDLAQVEALQRSTLHVSSSQLGNEFSSSLVPVVDVMQGASGNVALSCATGVKMTEAQLTLIENALKVEAAQRQEQRYLLQGGNPLKQLPSTGPVIGDWLRVPHSPLAGDSLSFHLPLHRALAKCVRSICSVVVPAAFVSANPNSWWKIPVLDDSSRSSDSTLLHHPLVPLIRSTLRSSNCRVVWSSGPDCTPQEAQRRRSRSRSVSANIAVAKVIHSLADHPIRCLAAAQQIERHLWARNGTSVAGMAMNYSSAPLCRSFRDLDLLLVQFSSSGMSCGLGARRVFSLLLSRFSMDGYLCDPERKPSASINSPSTFGSPMSIWVHPPRLQDPDHAVVLAESLFSTLCVIVTELPLLPPNSATDDSSLRLSIRRELLHALAAEPRSHSEAMTAAQVGISRREESEGATGKGGSGGLFRDSFAAVLRDIGKQKNQSSSRASSGPPAFELKAEFCDEYDPTFFHLRRQEHQHAMDIVVRLRKQKWGDNKEALETHCLPIVCAPPKSHARFLPCRLLLHLDSMDAALRRALLFALTNGSWIPPPEPLPKNGIEEEGGVTALDGVDKVGVFTSVASAPDSADVSMTTFNRRQYQTQSSSLSTFVKRSGADPTPFSGEVVAASSVSFLEVLQLLTLQVHTLEECASLHRGCPDLDDEARALSSGLSINSYLSRLVLVPDSLLDVWALRPFPQGPLKSKGTGENRGSILGLLIALYEHRSDHGTILDVDGGECGPSDDGHGGARALASSGLKWLLRFIHALVDGAPSVGTANRSATTGVPVRVASYICHTGSDSGSSTWTINEEVKSIIRGMLENLPDLWPMARKQSASPDKGHGKTKEDRKAAQQRVMEMMKRKQAAFAATMAPLDVPSGGNNEENEQETDLCIICRCDDADGENNGPLGYLGHVQRSRMLQMRSTGECFHRDEGKHALANSYRVVGHMGCQLRETEAMDSKPLTCLPKGNVVSVLKSKVSSQYDILSRRVLVRHVKKDALDKAEIVSEGWASVQSSQGYVILSPLVSLCYNNTRWGCTRPLIKQCGHAAHLKCVETHTLSLHQRAAGDQPYDGRFAANINEGEFLCPLCKQLSNILIPRDSVSSSRQSSAMDCDDSPKDNPSISKNCLFGSLRKRLIGSRSSSDCLTPMGRRALEDFGSHLHTAVCVPWERAAGTQAAKHEQWHPAIQKWDYEESDVDSISSDSVSVKNLLRLLRQQLIAWAAVGHSAAALEAGSRGVEEAMPFGVISETSDPWTEYSQVSMDTHPMLLELKRTLTGCSGLFEVLIIEMSHQLSGRDIKPSEATVIGSCLADILDGQSWIQNISSSKTIDEKNGIELWSEITALVSAIPSHVSRDGTIPLRCEARGTAAAMWVVKGLSCNTNTKTEPPAPLAIRQLFALKNQGHSMIPSNWGTMNPFMDKVDTCSQKSPFRLGVACGFLYIPLLAWDMNTLTGAMLSCMLSNKDNELPNGDELLRMAHYLLIGRILQAVIVPGGIDVPDEMELDDEDCWNAEEISSEGPALAKLVAHSREMVNGKCLVLPNELLEGSSDLCPSTLLAGVGRAILPFARALILMLRACTAVIRERQERSSSPVKENEEDTHLEAVLCRGEIMTVENGFHIANALRCPKPSDLVDGEWFLLINRWLVAVIGLEIHHGSMGRSIVHSVVSPAAANPASDARSPGPALIAAAMESPHKQLFTDDSAHGMAMDVDEPGGDTDDRILSVGRGGMDYVLQGDIDDSDDELAESMDEAEEMVGFELVVGATFGSSPAVASHADPGESSDNSSATPDDDHESDSKFANVSLSPILLFQSSLLSLFGIGPGRHGSTFEFSNANEVMADMSHLGLIHRKGPPTFSLIRLPKSFVELYNIVNKVKGRDENAALDENDDIGSSETSICLLTGAVMRSGTTRRVFSRATRSPGACTLHARKTASGIGIFFLVQKCTVLLMHNNKSAYSPSLYVDEHGEEDPQLRRGRPLFLNEARYRALDLLWRQQGIPREVAQIRSTSDRVIRDNWY